MLCNYNYTDFSTVSSEISLLESKSLNSSDSFDCFSISLWFDSVFISSSFAESLLVSMGIGFVILMGVIAGGYYRGFVDRLVIPPLVIFTVLSSICFYFGLM